MEEAEEKMKNMSQDELLDFTEGDTRKTIQKKVEETGSNKVEESEEG